MALDRENTQLFLTEGALHLLVVDLYKFAQDSSCHGDVLYVWLDVLMCRVPACKVLLVASHADKFGGDKERISAARSALEGAIAAHVETKRKEWKYAMDIIQAERQEDHGPLLREDEQEAAIPPTLSMCGILLTSCHNSADDLFSVRDKICELASIEGRDSDGTRLFPSVGQIIPRSWARAWATMDALHVGADPIEAASLRGPPLSIDGREKHNVVTREFALKTWAEVLSALGLCTAEGGELSQQEIDDLNVSDTCAVE